MGRKPNALVQEHFLRGQKLSDASNRYVHTCKRCGLVFPKGRVDALVSHLLRRCPSIAQEDRHLVYEAVQQRNPDRRRIQQRASATVVTNPQPTDASLSRQEPSALDTLAEVSRRHLDYSSSRAVHPPPVTDTGRDLAEQALLAQLQGHAAVDFLSSPLPGSASAHAAAPAEPGEDVHASPFVDPTATTTIPSSPLIHAASAAMARAAHAASRDNLDPELEDPIDAHPNIDHGDDHDPMNMTWNPAHISGSDDFAPSREHMPTLDHLPDLHPLEPAAAAKHRRRGQFSDTRRKEVQEIRKRGACIRCRMLKKPCSEGTPCSTCKNVESARLWKTSCLRTRLADACTLWSSGLYHAKAKIEVPASVHGLAQQPLPGRLEVQIFPQSRFCLTFAVRRYFRGPSLPHIEDLVRDGPHAYDARHLPPDDPAVPTAILLLDEGEGMSSKIEEYANEALTTCISAEPSFFIRRTLEHACALIDAERADNADMTPSSGPRSCYNLQSQQLLKNVIELWSETAILTSRESLDVRLRYNPTEHPQQQPVLIQHIPAAPPGAEQIPLSPSSEALIFAQLLAATESRCYALSRNVMNEIERRLLQRQQVSRFATFLSAVILMNCIERMTGVFRAYDKSPSTSVRSPRPDYADVPPESYPDLHNQDIRPADWPLQDAPRRYWSQGDHFADLLVMLLRMRALPPRTGITADGKLVVNREHPLPASLGRRSLKEQTEEQTIPAAWLDPLHLSAGDLLAKRDGTLPEHDQGIAEWNLRFISRVILPETIRL